MEKISICVCLCMAFVLAVGGSLCRAAEAAGGSQAVHWTFDKDRAGALPAGATVFAGKWVVRAESDAPSLPNALCQTGYSEYPALSLVDKVYTDVAITTQFKPISGGGDRAAGIIFRIRDKDNYYILRANALEDNVNVYKYTGGRRRVIQEGSSQVPSGMWQELRVEVQGNRIRGFLNNKQVVEAFDDTFKTGKIGLWTKADSVTCFDNIRVNPGK
jgi:hypothetical protein